LTLTNSKNLLKLQKYNFNKVKDRVTERNVFTMTKKIFDLQRFAVIRGTESHDYLTTETIDSVVYGYGGNDTVYNAFSNVTIEGGDGTDSLRSGGRSWYWGSLAGETVTSGISISGGSGNDYLRVNGSNSTITGDEGDDTILSDWNSNYLNGGSGHDSIKIATGANVSIFGEQGNDTLVNEGGTNPTIFGGAGEDKITNSGGYAYIDGGEDKDYIQTSAGVGVTIDGGSDKDTIKSSANNNGFIYGGSGDDLINAYDNTTNLTINGGAGNDTVSLTSAVSAFLQFAPSEGNDIVYGFDENDTLLVGGSYATVLNEDNSVNVNAGNSSLTLIGAKDKDLKIITGEIVLPNKISIENTLTGSESQDKFIYSGDTKTTVTGFSAGMSSTSDIVVLKGGSLAGIKRTSQTVTIKMSDGNYIELQTNSTSSEEIIMFSFDGTTNFGMKIAEESASSLSYYEGASYFQLSQQGSLIVNDSAENNIWLDGSAGKLFVNVANIDASSSTGHNILAGDTASNKITAGGGNDLLWGGVGGNDTLTGGAGADVFFFGKNDGSDFITNASSSDIVNLYDVSINDITSLDTSNNQITIGLSTGANLQINSAENVSAKITMAEGSVNFNHSTKQWQLV